MSLKGQKTGSGNTEDSFNCVLCNCSCCLLARALICLRTPEYSSMIQTDSYDFLMQNVLLLFQLSIDKIFFAECSTLWTLVRMYIEENYFTLLPLWGFD